MRQHLFAMVDNCIANEIRVKILRITEVGNRYQYHHTITPYVNDHPRILNMYKATTRDTNLQKISLDSGPIYLWRTLYTVQYGAAVIPILDSNMRESIGGEYDYRVLVLMDQCADFMEQVQTLRRRMPMMRGNMARTPRLPAPPPPPQIPKFVTDALKRDAIQRNYTCPITMDPITDGPAAITSCYHIFSQEAINESLQRSRVCPFCRESVAFVQPL